MYDNIPKRNAEDYKDETAYDGMKRALQPTEGEIYAFWNAKSKANQEFLVLKNNGRFLNILMLQDKEYNGSYIVHSTGIKYTDPRMVEYMFADKPMQFVKKLPAAEFDVIFRAAAENYGVRPAEAPNVQAAVDEITDILQEILPALCRSILREKG